MDDQTITLEQFGAKCLARELAVGESPGQAFSEMLFSYRRSLHHKLRAAGLDPWGARSPNLLDASLWVREHWEDTIDSVTSPLTPVAVAVSAYMNNAGYTNMYQVLRTAAPTMLDPLAVVLEENFMDELNDLDGDLL